MFGFGDLGAEAAEGSTRWIHVPARGKLRLVLLSPEATRYEAHWVGNRMLACPGPRVCPWHARHMGVQVRYAWSVQDVDTRARGFFEVGPSTAQQMYPAMCEFGRVRGLCFEYAHEGQRKNGLVVARSLGRLMSDELLPAAESPWEQIERQIAAEAGKGMPAPMPDNWVATQAPSLVLPVEDVEPPSTYAVRAAQRAGEAAGGRPSAPDS